jgi:hypothetical protein
MDTQKITADFGVQSQPWKAALRDCLQRLGEME